MKIKQEAAIIIIIAVALVGIFLLVYVYQKQNNHSDPNIDELNARMMQNVKNRANEKKVEEVVQKRLEEKRQELNKKPQEEIRKNGYTPEELRFIEDPRRAVEAELGIESSASTTNPGRMTQEQINAVLDANKK